MCHGQYEYSYRELGPNMNIHITWLTYVRTGPKKKKSRPGRCRVSEWATARAQRPRVRRETKTTQLNTRMATADHDRQGQAAHRQYNLMHSS